MRIVHVTGGYWPQLGGAEIHVQKVSEGLARRGHHVTVLTIRGNETSQSFMAPRSELVNSVRVLRFTENKSVERLLHLRGAYRVLRAIAPEDRVRMIGRGPLSGQLVMELLRCKADVVGVFGWWASVLPFQVCVAKRFRQWPMVGIPLFHTQEAWSKEAVYPPMLRRCDAIVTNTAYEKQFIEERLSGHARVLVGGVGIDVDAYSDRRGPQIRTRYGMGNGPVVGYVGRIVPSKGVTWLIRSMRVVWQWNQTALLVLAGPRTLAGMQADRDVDLVLAELSEAERARVLLLGEFDERDKASIFDSFDVLAMPSTGESFGITYLEAWICQKPVIGANVGSTPHVIRNEVDGLLVDPYDPADIGQAIVRLLKNPAERTRFGQAGYARTMSEFTWDRVIDRIDGLYKELQPGRSAVAPDGPS